MEKSVIHSSVKETIAGTHKEILLTVNEKIYNQFCQLFIKTPVIILDSQIPEEVLNWYKFNVFSQSSGDKIHDGQEKVQSQKMLPKSKPGKSVVLKPDPQIIEFDSSESIIVDAQRADDSFNSKQSENLEQEKQSQVAEKTNQPEAEKIEIDQLEEKKDEAKSEIKLSESEAIEIDQAEPEAIESDYLMPTNIEAEQSEPTTLQNDLTTSTNIETDQSETEKIEIDQTEPEAIESDHSESKNPDVDLLGPEPIEMDQFTFENITDDQIESHKAEVDKSESANTNTDHSSMEIVNGNQKEWEESESDNPLEKSADESKKMEAEKEKEEETIDKVTANDNESISYLKHNSSVWSAIEDENNELDFDED